MGFVGALKLPDFGTSDSPHPNPSPEGEGLLDVSTRRRTGITSTKDKHAAGEPVAAVAGRVRFIIIGLRVDDNRGSVSVQQAAVPEQVALMDVKVQQTTSLGIDDQIGQIAAVAAVRVFPSMLLSVGVPVRASRRELGCFAFSDRVNVEAVYAL